MRRRRRMQPDVELNLAAMLDMAFQLLAFFVLTFKPSPIEGQIALLLPPPQALTNVDAKKAGSATATTDPVSGLNTLVISAFSTESGAIDSLAIGEGAIDNLEQLDLRLKTVLTDPSSPFDQVLIQAGSRLSYEALMKVIDICTRQKLHNGQRLVKLSFVELPDEVPEGAGGG